MIRAVLTDFDGVIMPVDLVAKGLKQALAEYGIQVTERFVKEKIIGRRVVEALPDLFGLPLEKCLEIRARYHEIYQKLALKSEPFPGATELFDFCRENGLKTGIISTKARNETEPILEHLGINPDVAVFQEDVKKVKPDPEPILLALSKLSLAPTEAVFIGDHVVDILAGKNAGVLAIGVLTGIGTEKDLENAGADLVFPTLLDFLNWLERELNGV